MYDVCAIEDRESSMHINIHTHSVVRDNCPPHLFGDSGQTSDGGSGCFSSCFCLGGMKGKEEKEDISNNGAGMVRKLRMEW